LENRYGLLAVDDGLHAINPPQRQLVGAPDYSPKVRAYLVKGVLTGFEASGRFDGSVGVSSDRRLLQKIENTQEAVLDAPRGQWQTQRFGVRIRIGPR
jgi:hypothetical protein